MTKEQKIKEIKKSEWWNENYENYDGRSTKAQDFLKKIKGKTKELGIKVLVGFEEPDYGRYREAWQAKEARWIPEFIMA